ncbi:MAG: cytochrome c biogenesis protein CcdA [Acidobacteriia bacterium]|jgi:cytochrome c-type biogenesis protein|nr:cytochrome c biogenesis protein CcdA [Terriglobia bacterium]
MSSLPLPIAVFFAGIASFLSPCVLPLVPGYVSLISGVTAEQLESKDSKVLKTVLFHSIMFILGFTLVFVILGAAATGLGHAFRMYKKQLSWVAGIIIVIFGLHLTGILKIKALYADKRLHSAGSGKSPFGAFVVGFAFAFGWTPCIGPILSLILAAAGSEDTVTKGILLLSIYSLGLAVPFLLTSIAMDRFMGFYGWFRRHLHTVEVISGVLLIVFGVLIFTQHFTVLSSYLGFLNRFTW